MDALAFEPFPVVNNAFTEAAALVDGSTTSSSSKRGGARRIVNLAPALAQQTSLDAGSTLLPTLLQSISLLLSPTATSDFAPLAQVVAKLHAPLESLHGACRTLVVAHGKGEVIYEGLRVELEKSAGGFVRVWRDVAGDKEGDEWIQTVVDGWDWWSERIDLVRSVLLPLDRSYVLATSGSVSILDLSRKIFHDTVFAPSSSAFSKTIAALVRWVTQARNLGSLPSEPLVTALVKGILTTLDLRSTLLLPPLLDATKAYFTTQQTSLFALPAAEYISHVSALLRAEETRMSTVFGLDARAGGIVEAVEDVMLRSCGTELIKRGIAELMIGGKATEAEVGTAAALEDAEDDEGEGDKGKEKTSGKTKGSVPNEEGLKHLITLLRSVGLEAGLKPVWSDWIKNHVETLISDPQKDNLMVGSLLTFRAQIDSILSGAFALRGPSGSLDRDRVLVEAAHAAFTNGMTKRKNKPAEMIAKAIDHLLRSRSTSSDTVSQQLDDLLTLVRYTRDKDVFKAFYVTGLAKRLLLGRSASDDAELGMVTRLKKELGDDFTTGDGMMADLNLSAELMKNYRAKTDPSEDMDLTVSVLSNANWPSYPALAEGWESFQLPQPLESALDRFKTFYTSAHQGRLLDWRYQLFSLTLKARFPLGTKELSVSLFQAMVLFLFNDREESGEKLEWQEIRDQTGIESEELSRTLQSLACGKIRVLVKEPIGRDVKQTDRFSFNVKFTSERVKLKVNQIQVNQSAEEDERTETRVLHDRSHLLDAAIVRIMKGKKKSTWNELTNLVVDAVAKTFPPEVKAIKQQIESLIEREYLARDEEDSMKVLHYLA